MVAVDRTQMVIFERGVGYPVFFYLCERLWSLAWLEHERFGTKLTSSSFVASSYFINSM